VVSIIKTLIIFFVCAYNVSVAYSSQDQWTYGLTLGDSLKYNQDFKNFDYVNPESPKGGKIRRAVVGTFDTLNPFNIKGTPAYGSFDIYDTLMTGSDDEPFSYYGLIAESVSYPDDYSYVTYKIRKNAKWHDGQPITPEDVVWSLNILKENHPHYKFYYKNILRVEKTSDYEVRFYFDQKGNRELPLITGQFPVLPKHYWESKDRDGLVRDFGNSTLEFPLGSGPYKFSEISAGRNIKYERVKNYWAKDLPVNRGLYNFNQIIFEYFRDPTVLLEAFKAGEIDFVFENSAKRWATGYDSKALLDGKIKLEVFESKNVQGMQAFVFNTRRNKFKDVKVRKAFNLAFDFEWLNENIFYNQYKRIDSYFDNSELESREAPVDEELEILINMSSSLSNEVFTDIYQNSIGGNSKNNRNNLREASILLKESGWSFEDGKLLSSFTNETFKVEFLVSQSDMERIINPYIKNLRLLGIEANIRVVDITQYQQRIDNFDFDIIIDNFPQSLSPGNEQRDYWGSESAGLAGSKNTIGIEDEAVDKLINRIIFAKDRSELVAATKALDRVLKLNYFVVPHYYSSGIRTARWDKFDRADVIPGYNFNLSTWWEKSN
jgi:microcin C transport system substrate-binding protein